MQKKNVHLAIEHVLVEAVGSLLLGLWLVFEFVFDLEDLRQILQLSSLKSDVRDFIRHAMAYLSFVGDVFSCDFEVVSCAVGSEIRVHQGIWSGNSPVTSNVVMAEIVAQAFNRVGRQVVFVFANDVFGRNRCT